jgi:hypothetical protein
MMPSREPRALATFLAWSLANEAVSSPIPNGETTVEFGHVKRADYGWHRVLYKILISEIDLRAVRALLKP